MRSPAIFVGLVLLRAAASGQDLAGFVRDSTGAALEGAAVTVMDEDTGVRRIARTGPDGAYAVFGLPAGPYRVTVRQPGFQSIVRWNVRIEAATALRLDFLVQVGSMRETITVEGSAPQINAHDASVGASLEHDAAGRLPVGPRGLLALVELAPAVVSTPAAHGEAGQFSAAGSRPNTNYFTVDGVSGNNGVSGGGLPAQFAGNALPAMTAFGSTQNLVSSDALEEVHVLTSTFAPEHGRLPGAQVELTTRSGSNQTHGSAFYGARPDALAARDWFANAAAGPHTPLRLNQWGATVGAPLRRDRAFFFVCYDALRLAEPYTSTIVTPSVHIRETAPPAARPVLNAFPWPDRTTGNADLSTRTAGYSRASRLDAAALRIDYALSDGLTLFGRYNRAPSYAESGFAQVEHLHLHSASFTLAATASLAPNLTNDARINVWNSDAVSEFSPNPASGGIQPDFTALFQRTPAGPTFYGIAVDVVGAMYWGQSGRNRQRQWNLVDAVAVRRGAHDIRFGIDYQRLAPTRESAAESVTGEWSSLASLLAGAPPTVTSVRAESASALIETLSGFFQDGWSVTPRLALTYGVRWELTPAPAMRQPAGVFASTGPPAFAGLADSGLSVTSLNEELWRTRYAQLAPRAGIALRLSGDSVLRAGWGIFYDVAFSAALNPINGFPFNRWQFGSGAAGTTAGDVPAYGLRYQRDLKLPYTHEWNVAYERAFGRVNAASVSYVGSSGRRLLRHEVPRNPARGRRSTLWRPTADLPSITP